MEVRSWSAMVLMNMILQAPEQFSPPLFPVMHSLGVSPCPGGKAFWRCSRAAWKQGLLCESRCASLRRCSIGRACASESGHCAEKPRNPGYSPRYLGAWPRFLQTHCCGILVAWTAAQTGLTLQVSSFLQKQVCE